LKKDNDANYVTDKKITFEKYIFLKESLNFKVFCCWARWYISHGL